MKKNGILTLLFACIPGAGQMYQGYMKQGALAHHHVLPVYYPRQHHGAGRTGSRLHRCVYVQLFSIP